MEDAGILELFLARSEEAVKETEKKYAGYCYSIAFLKREAVGTGGVYINNLKSDIGFSSLGSTLQTDRKIMINSQGFFIFFARKYGVKDKKSLTFIFLKHIIKEKDEK